MKHLIFLLTTVLAVMPSPLSFAADTDLSELAAANNAFAFKLLRELNAETKSGNIFVSPYSAATALHMAANGAVGETKVEMQKVLETAGFTQEDLNAAIKAAMTLLNSWDTNVILSTANALWYRQSAQIKPEFLAANQEYFGATIKPLDFDNKSTAESVINRWTSDQTHGRITGIADGLIKPETDMVSVNAIYFKGKWLNRFDANLTKERPFHSATGLTRKVSMMAKSENFSYHRGYGYQTVRLPYRGGELGMYVFLTDTNYSPETLVQNLNSDIWRRVITTGFSDENGLVVLPKFKLENTFELIPSLEKLGMKLPFDKRQADFSEMFNDHDHWIDVVRQKTFVNVTEEGTEAAAATEYTPVLSAPFRMIVDRPFLFAIVDGRSEMILFLGVVNEL